MESNAWLGRNCASVGSDGRVEGTSSAVRFDLDVFGLSMVEHNPGVDATGYGMLADFIRAVQT